MSDVPEIKGDHACACGYNLRGLTFDHRCPECGKPAAESVRFVMRLAKPRDETEAQRRADVRRRIGVAAEASGYPADAFLLLWGSWLYGRRNRDVQAGKSAQLICQNFRTYARINQGGEASASLTLARWKIKGSEDVGRMVYRLIEQDLLRPEEGDSIRDFDGLFTLDNLFTADL